MSNGSTEPDKYAEVTRLVHAATGAGAAALAASSDVMANTMIASADGPLLTQAFCPVIRYPSPTASARVVSSLGCAPTFGSEIATASAFPDHAARWASEPNDRKCRNTRCRPPQTLATPSSPVRSTSAALMRAMDE